VSDKPEDRLRVVRHLSDNADSKSKARRGKAWLALFLSDNCLIMGARFFRTKGSGYLKNKEGVVFYVIGGSGFLVVQPAFLAAARRFL
jgi:hypothetical protein